MDSTSITAQNLGVLLGMALFFGLAFENFFARELPDRPGGIRSFPMLALAGGGAYVLAPHTGLVFSTGLAVLGLWLFAYYRAQDPGRRDFIVPVCNVLAYLLGALAVTQPPWVVVAVTVAATVLLASRTRLHDVANRIPVDEILTAAQFLLLVGVALPLLPDVPIAGIAELTPHRILLAIAAVSTLSYCSYLLTRYVRPKGATLLAATLGGLYSSTATTVVLARRSRAGASADLSAGIVVATAFMYLRLLAIVAVFNLALGLTLWISLVSLFVAGIAAAATTYALCGGRRSNSEPLDEPANPLQLGAALVFAVLFVAVTLATNLARTHFGRYGLDALAAVVGVTDVDPFVLSIAQGHIAALPVLAQAILIAASSNNVLKAIYAFGFGGGRRMWPPVIALLGLAACSVVAALFVYR